MRLPWLVLLFAVATPVLGQNGPCTETNIRNSLEKHGVKQTEDFYFFSGAYDEPVIGSTGMQSADQHPLPRKNSSRSPHVISKIVVSPSGDMAYEYGTVHLSYDDTELNMHSDFKIAYLRVWRAVGDKCELAAESDTPEHLHELEMQTADAVCKQRKEPSTATAK